MRTITNINTKWYFSKKCNDIPQTLPDSWEEINLPHTWNGVDGQNGGNNYHRGTCFYAKTFTKNELPKAEKYYLEINGANSSCNVYLNNTFLGHHDGGYSTWRLQITGTVNENNLLFIEVDNSPNKAVYPQVADFTFYGGLYRDVNIIGVCESHFDLDYYGGPGIKVTPIIENVNARIEVEVFINNLKENQKLHYTIYDSNKKVINECLSKNTLLEMNISNVHLWHGRIDPYLYSVKVELIQDDNIIDCVSTKFACRTFKVDPENGFILNGKEYPLRGVCRHQDRDQTGNALKHEHHIEDMDLICELGANTIRLAHYQHDQFFYDLCDERGMIVWAEIPYISEHMSNGKDNTINQMKELIIQNYNHPSIVVWGLSNEITMKGDKDPDLIENHKILNDLVHEMDKTRLTTIACISHCPIDSPYIQIPDLVSYNHYFGWYGGDVSMNGPWFDDFHKQYPNIPIGCSEYGCEALNWHNSNPIQGDYSEEYQAYYHEELIKQLFSRKYIWATHLWNMFDFGADARCEGGENGQNHKGLVTIDRKYKKDAFYAYKAWLSKEPFVHICSKRYIDRVEDITNVTVYSNLPEVELIVNGISVEKKTALDHFFHFEVKNIGESKIEVIATNCKDESIIRKVDTFNEEYRLKDKNAVLNWFDITAPEGYYSINDTINDIASSLKGKIVLAEFMAKLARKAKAKESSNVFEMNESSKNMIGGFTILRITSMIGMMDISFTKEELLDINKKLNKIKKKV